MNTISCSKVFLVLLVTLFPTQILAQNAILAVCDKTLYKELCISTLQSDPASESATSFEDAATIILKNATSTATQISDQLTKMIQQGSSQWSGGDLTALANCKKYYQDAIGKLADSSKALASRMYNDVKKGMLSAMGAGPLCDDDFEAYGSTGTSPLGNQGDTYNSICALVYELCMAIAS
ncbi:uncharacterized protein LOC132182173 [Corylus avellana]|uniref:uncharacterized protein LOC132182173 n=1 Tax=Corylus avellana TaxID=13451 RepID=UPI00286D5F82|nr:uncharacterized protein LOC132182173 [Corylus avellana]